MARIYQDQAGAAGADPGGNHRLNHNQLLSQPNASAAQQTTTMSSMLKLRTSMRFQEVTLSGPGLKREPEIKTNPYLTSKKSIQIWQKTKSKSLGDRVLVKPVESEEEVKGGIIIPDSAKEKPTTAEVLVLGNGQEGRRDSRVLRQGW
jgi:hypothetical protein